MELILFLKSSPAEPWGNCLQGPYFTDKADQHWPCQSPLGDCWKHTGKSGTAFTLTIFLMTIGPLLPSS